MNIEDEQLIYLDIGARWGINKKMDGTERHSFSKYFKNIKYIGFEPDRVEFERIVRNKKPNEEYYNVGLGDKLKGRTFYNLKSPDWSSLYKPIETECNKFASIKESTKIVSTLRCKTFRLDSIIIDADFMKLDTEGSELDILKGSSNILDNILGIEVETYFYKLREKQPLFSEIYNYLIKYNFILFDISRNKYYRNRPIMPGLGQLIWGDAMFFKNHEVIKDEEKLKKLYYMSLSLGYYDYALDIRLKHNLNVKDDIDFYSVDEKYKNYQFMRD